MHLSARHSGTRHAAGVARSAPLVDDVFLASVNKRLRQSRSRSKSAKLLRNFKLVVDLERMSSSCYIRLSPSSVLLLFWALSILQRRKRPLIRNPIAAYSASIRVSYSPRLLVYVYTIRGIQSESKVNDRRWRVQVEKRQGGGGGAREDAVA